MNEKKKSTTRATRLTRATPKQLKPDHKSQFIVKSVEKEKGI